MVYRRREALWIPQGRLRQGSVPAAIKPWLLDRGSLTQRIIDACDKPFRVELRGQTWQRPLQSESRLLQLRKGSDALVRQVNLLCGERRWVYARTVIPRQTMQGDLRRLANLGNRPLGAFLFAYPGMQRLEVEVAPLRSGDGLYEQAVAGLSQQPEVIWGRRSLFCLKHKPVLVYEVFLPTILGEE